MGDVIAIILKWILDNLTDISTSEYLTFTQEDVNLVKSIWDYFAIVGIGMTLIYFLMEMNRKLALEGGDLNFKSFFSPFLKLMIAVAVLSQSANIVGWILDFNNAMLTGIDTSAITAAATDDLADTIDGLIEKVNVLGFFAAIALLLPILICALCSLIVNVIWLWKGMIYKLEVLFRIGITPIACADIYSGANSTAIRYLKNFLALGIYAVSFVILPKLSASLSVSGIANSDSFFGVVNSLVGLIVAPFAAISCSSAVKTAAKEALGA